jgi:hypothetical protein
VKESHPTKTIEIFPAENNIPNVVILPRAKHKKFRRFPFEPHPRSLPGTTVVRSDAVPAMPQRWLPEGRVVMVVDEQRLVKPKRYLHQNHEVHPQTRS